MDPSAAKLIGAGLAVMPLLGVGVGLGILFSNVISVMGRNPSASEGVQKQALIYFALVEAAGLFGLVIALMILYAF